MKLRRCVWVPLFVPSLKKVWIRLWSTLKKKLEIHISELIYSFLNIGLRPKLGNTYCHIMGRSPNYGRNSNILIPDP
jgi:hypothetical protein